MENRENKYTIDENFKNQNDGNAISHSHLLLAFWARKQTPLKIKI